MNRITHLGFSDESNWNDGRFRSLGLVTTSLDLYEALNGQLQHLLEESKVKEFKWKNLTGAKERFAAGKLCSFAIEQACHRKLRIDVLIWDIQDRRHNLRGRDDIANLQRMYYHLFRNVLGMRWPNDAVWRLCPDEHTAIEWDTVQDCLENVSERVVSERNLFTQGSFKLRLQKEFGIDTIEPVRSEQEPLVQLTDLFAGLAVFSREKFPLYQQWLQHTSPQHTLFEGSEMEGRLSTSDEERFQVLKEFDQGCKKRKLGVSLKSSKGLMTHDPARPINFWHYEPQHPEDKAPTRKGNNEDGL